MGLVLYNFMKRFIQADIILYFFLLCFGVGGLFLTLVWPHAEGFHAFIVSAAVAGFVVAAYIFYAKQFKKELACPTGSNCNVVVESKYGKFAGVPLEFWGMGYYVAIAATYIAFLFSPDLKSGIFLATVSLLTAAAFLFSLYLIFVQAFLLKEWCIWCLLSAALSIGIFIASLSSISGADAILADIRPALYFVKNLGFVLGMGGAVASIFLFFKFLKDFCIDDKEANALKGITEMIWLGLAFIFVSEYANYVARPQELSQSGIFFAEMVSFFVVLLSGAILKILFAPFLVVLPFQKAKDGEKQASGFIMGLRRATLIVGAIALSSWFFAFVLGYLPEYPIEKLIGAYLTLLVVSAFVALLWEQNMRKCE